MSNNTLSSISLGAVALAALAAVVIIIDIPPLIWHFTNKNIAAFSLVLWLIVLNLMTFTNVLLWPTDDISTWFDGQGLCDIQVRLFLASNYALSGSLLCIMQGLAKVMDTDRVVITQSRKDKIKKTTLDLTFCFGVPIALSIFHLVTDQPARYIIKTVEGCAVPVSYNWVTLVFVLLVPPCLSLVASFHAVMVMYRMYRYRREFSALLQRSNTTKARFIRLFAMTQVLINGTLPLQLYNLSISLAGVQLEPYSWSIIHDNWTNIIIFLPTGGVISPSIWARIVSGLLAFLFFGTGSEAISTYRSWLVKLGLDKLFPSLLRQRMGSMSSPTRMTLGSIGSKAKFWTNWRVRKGSASTTTSVAKLAESPCFLTMPTGYGSRQQNLDDIHITRGSIVFDIAPHMEAQDGLSIQSTQEYSMRT